MSVRPVRAAAAAAAIKIKAIVAHESRKDPIPIPLLNVKKLLGKYVPTGPVLYFIRFTARNEPDMRADKIPLIKVGVTTDLKTRLATIGASAYCADEEMTVLAIVGHESIDDALILEKIIKCRMKSQCASVPDRLGSVRHEVFKCSRSNISRVCDLIEKELESSSEDE